DPNAYAFHRRFGARLLGGEGGLIRYRVLTPKVLETLPSTGLCFGSRWWSRDNDEEPDDCPGYVYFHKVKRLPWNIEHCPDALAVYDFALAFYDAATGQTFGYDCAIAVMSDGQPRALKSMHHEYHRLPNSRGFMRKKFELSSRIEVHRLDRVRAGCHDMP